MFKIAANFHRVSPTVPRVLTLTALCTLWPLAALSRPGTPNNVELVSPAPETLRFYFTNTAAGDLLSDEKVVFDFNLERLPAVTAKYDDPANQQLDSRTFFNCQPLKMAIPGSKNVLSPTSCGEAMTWSAPTNFSSAIGSPFHGPGDENLAVWGNSFEPNVKYCARVRAREWNSGNPQGGQVSEKWSAWVCATVAQLKALSRPGVLFTPARGAAPSRATIILNAYTPAEGISLAVEKWDVKAWVPRPDINQWTTVGKVTTAWEERVAAPSPAAVLRYRVCLVTSKERVCSVPGEAADMTHSPKPVKLP